MACFFSSSVSLAEERGERRRKGKKPGHVRERTFDDYYTTYVWGHSTFMPF